MKVRKSRVDLASKPLFALSARGFLRCSARRGRDSRRVQLEQARLRDGHGVSAPQARARDYVARGVEALRGRALRRQQPRPSVRIPHVIDSACTGFAPRILTLRSEI